MASIANMREDNWVVFTGTFPTPHDGKVAEVKEVIPFGDSVRIGLQFVLDDDDSYLGAYPEECELVVQWQGA